jgi:hypothetical protein
MGIYLIVKNNNISPSSRYLGLFFIAIGAAPLTLFLFKMSFYGAFILSSLIFSTHMFWFYFYINSVIGNKISKFNYYFSLSFFSLAFILNIYTFLEIYQSGLFSSQIELFPFQILDNGQFSSITKFYFLYRVFISFLIEIEFLQSFRKILIISNKKIII